MGVASCAGKSRKKRLTQPLVLISSRFKVMYRSVSHVEVVSLYYSNGFAVVALFDSIIFSPNVLPLSLLTLSTGSLLVALRSHQLTYTLFPDAAIYTSCDCVLVELLSSSCPQMFTTSVDALNITLSFPFPVLLFHHAK
jgi:hypothetical protein